MIKTENGYQIDANINFMSSHMLEGHGCKITQK